MSAKSILISTIYFLALFVATIPFFGDLVNTSFVAGSLVAFFVWVSPGYVAASLAKENGVIHAIASAVLSCLIATALVYFVPIGGDSKEMISSMLLTLVVGFGFGGVIWHAKNWHTHSNT